MRKIQYLVVHCTASSQRNTTVERLREHWKEIGWHAPGYHYLVMPSGRLEQLCSEDSVCNGVKGYNSVSVHVAYVGGIDHAGQPIDNRTEAQKASLYFLLERLREKYPAARILGHRELSPDLNGDGLISREEFIKECPCFDAGKEYAGI